MDNLFKIQYSTEQNHEYNIMIEYYIIGIFLLISINTTGNKSIPADTEISFPAPKGFVSVSGALCGNNLASKPIQYLSNGIFKIFSSNGILPYSFFGQLFTIKKTI